MANAKFQGAGEAYPQRTAILWEKKAMAERTINGSAIYGIAKTFCSPCSTSTGQNPSMWVFWFLPCRRESPNSAVTVHATVNTQGVSFKVLKQRTGAQPMSAVATAAPTLPWQPGSTDELPMPNRAEIGLPPASPTQTTDQPKWFSSSNKVAVTIKRPPGKTAFKVVGRLSPAGFCLRCRNPGRLQLRKVSRRLSLQTCSEAGSGRVRCRSRPPRSTADPPDKAIVAP